MSNRKPHSINDVTSWGFPDISIAEVGAMSYNTGYPGCPVKNCDLSNEFFGWYDSIAGLRLITSCLSVLGSASIVWVSIISRRLKSADIHPIFMISMADMFLSLLYIVGSSLWLLDDAYPSSSPLSSVNASHSTNGACLYISVFSTWMHLASNNLTVLYGVFVFIGLRKMKMHVKNVAYSNFRYTCFTIICYLLAWFTPCIVTLVVFHQTILKKDLISEADRCGCWCKPSVINGLPVMWLQNKSDESPYLDKLFDYAIAMYTVMIINIAVGFVLLVVTYGLVMWYLKNLKEYGGLLHRENDYLSPDKSFKAKLRMYTFVAIFITTGLVNFILLCDAVNFVHKEDKYIGSQITDAKHREFAILLILQSLTVSLQGFLNALVYGWTRQDFVGGLHLGSNTLENLDTQRSQAGNSGYQPVGSDFHQISQ